MCHRLTKHRISQSGLSPKIPNLIAMGILIGNEWNGCRDIKYAIKTEVGTKFNIVDGGLNDLDSKFNINDGDLRNWPLYMQLRQSLAIRRNWVC